MIGRLLSWDFRLSIHSLTYKAVTQTATKTSKNTILLVGMAASTNVASSASAFELLTRFDTGQRCR
jgi:hypothetical protein